MRLPTKKLDKGYLHKFYRLDVENESVVITELKPFIDGSNLAYRTDTNECMSINRRTNEIISHGKSKKVLQSAKYISGLTFGLEYIIRPLGFKWSYVYRCWENINSLASTK